MNNLLKNWDAARLIRLVLGIGITIYAIISKDYIFLILSALLLLQAIFNISCCSTGACSTSSNTKQVYKNIIKPYNNK